MKKTVNIGCGLMIALLVGTALWAGSQIVRLNMLTPKLLWPLLLGMTALVLLLIFLMLPRVGRKERKMTGRVIAGLLSLALSAGFVGGAMAIGKANHTIDTITTEQEHVVMVKVYVEKNSSAQSLEDVQLFGWSEAFDPLNTKSAIQRMEEQQGMKLPLLQYASVPELVDALYAGEVQGIILNSAYIGILEGFEGYEAFREQTREFYSCEVPQQEQIPEKLPEAPKPEAEEPEEEEEPSFLVYLSGVDTRDQGPTAGLSDVNILAAVNPNTRQVLLINTPRDYYVPNPAVGGGVRDKLTDCGAYGVRNSLQTLSDLYDEKIEYYARVNFTGFETLVDAIGGVTVESDFDFYSNADHFVKGPNELNGERALLFARTRLPFKAQDLQRGKHQMNLIMAIVEKVTSSTALITNYAEVMESLQGMFTTNVPRELIERMVQLQLEDLSPWHFQTYTVNGTSDMQYTNCSGNFHAYVLWPNEPSLEQGHDLIEKVFAGEPITDEMLIPPEAPTLEEINGEAEPETPGA